MKIFDVNLSTGRWPFRRLPQENLADLDAAVAKAGISGGLVRSLDAPFSLNINEENERLLEVCRPFTHLISVPAVRPDFGLWRQITGDFAVLHPNYHSYSLLADETLEMVETLLNRKIIPLIVIREEDERGQHPLCKVPPVPADEINQLAAKFSDKPFIVLNAIFEYMNLTEPNIYLDFSFFESFPALKNPVEKLGCKRILFGSHAPFFCISAAKSKLSYDKLKFEDIEDITHKNMERILNER